MLQIALSPKGIRLKILVNRACESTTADIYVGNRLQPYLMPSIKRHYPHGGHIILFCQGHNPLKTNNDGLT